MTYQFAVILSDNPENKNKCNSLNEQFQKQRNSSTKPTQIQNSGGNPIKHLEENQ